ncbi:YajG family lipoprotein [Candidatus Enterovibrio altilux]|uniref:Putative lipoprotein YajG n=1 Tax=Candidatus Enterovibrio altilux TaxID=1927128 RepID=A0A291B6G4_9GAMM|nr:YajG family lipoprotein [Candidatus Enterovibrio luxaltus]ATF08583.1 putative lipoprotein YajG precursor [Candidatus Enterovibrio luxaltus]
MKKLLLVSGFILALSACSTSKKSQLTISPQPTISSIAITQNVLVMVESRDLRTAQFVAIIDNGPQNIQLIHPTSNMRIMLENALIRQLSSQGYRVTTHAKGKLRLDLLNSLVKVEYSAFSHTITTNVQIQLVAETSNNKFVQRYSGQSTTQGTISASFVDMEIALNRLLEAALQDIARDKKLSSFMNKNF